MDFLIGMRYLRASRFVLISGILCCTAVVAVVACECYGPGTAEEALQISTAVFAAEVVAIEPIGESTSSMVEFRVLAAWKGVESPTIFAVTKDWGLCGYPFDVGSKYLVYAQTNGDGLIVDNCHRTYPLVVSSEFEAQARSDMSELGRPVRIWQSVE